MATDTLELGRGELRRAQAAERIIQRALLAIDAAFDRAEGRAKPPAANHEPNWDAKPHPNTGWTKDGKEHVHVSAPGFRFGKMGAGSSAPWCWRRKDETKWSARAYETRIEALEAAKAGKDAPPRTNPVTERTEDRVRRAIKLRNVDGLSFSEIAERLGMKESGVEAIFKRLRAKEYADVKG